MGTFANFSLGLGTEFGSGPSNGTSSEQDANAALVELDKALRSFKVGDQCEAIVRYSRLFEKFPFPILINSAFLRLADVFVTGNNFLRLCVVQVVQQSRLHLDKIINVDEFLRRIFQVIHSNDPVARAVTLRLLGEMARVMPERTSVHHAIRCALDSHDKVELEAAIAAAFSFAKESKTFASSIFGKLSSMVDGLETPAEMKLKLIPIFQAMHHDNRLCRSVRSFLAGSPTESSLLRGASQSSSTNFLATHPSLPFVVVVLDTLTRLATASVVDIPDQVLLLVRRLREDPRIGVKRCALRGLATLADENPHRWDAESLEELMEFVTKILDLAEMETGDEEHKRMSSSSAQLLTSTLRVLISLSKSVGLKDTIFSPSSSALHLIFPRLCYHDDLRVSASACELLCDAANEASREDIYDAASGALQTFLIGAVQTSQDGSALTNRKPFPWNAAKKGLKCVVRLSRAKPRDALGFVSIIASLLKMADEEMELLLLETLAAVGASDGAALCPCVEDLTESLRRTPSSTDSRRLELLSTLVLQAASARPDSPTVCVALEAVDAVFGDLSSSEGRRWTAYRVSRQAARYGHHGVAVKLLERLCSRGVVSTFLAAWLRGFYHLCRVEETLARMKRVPHSSLNESSESFPGDDHSTSPLGSLLSAVEAAHLGVTQLFAASTPAHALAFPIQLARLRSSSLQSCVQLIRACNCLRTCPPPAIASTSAAGAVAGDMAKGSRIGTQLHAVSKEFRALADQISNLLQASFDADALSLKYLNLLRLAASILISAIDSLLVHAPSATGQKSRNLASSQVLNSLIGGADSSSLLDAESSPLDLRRQTESCRTAMRKLSSVLEKEGRPLPSVDQRVELIQELCLILIAQPLPFPRYFFQSLQVTNIKLAISPQPKVIGEPVTVMPDTHLVLKVEGVIQRGSSSGDSGSALSVDSSPLSRIRRAKGKDATGSSVKRHRDIQKIIMSLKTTLQSRSASSIEVNLKPEVISQSMTRSVFPQNDYFCQQFLLAFPVAGIHHLAIAVSVQDDVGAEWATGPKASLSAKVLEAADPASSRRNPEPLIGPSNVHSSQYP